MLPPKNQGVSNRKSQNQVRRAESKKIGAPRSLNKSKSRWTVFGEQSSSAASSYAVTAPFALRIAEHRSNTRRIRVRVKAEWRMFWHAGPVLLLLLAHGQITARYIEPTGIGFGDGRLLPAKGECG